MAFPDSSSVLDKNFSLRRKVSIGSQGETGHFVRALVIVLSVLSCKAATHMFCRLLLSFANQLW